MRIATAVPCILTATFVAASPAQKPENGVLPVGGFRCIDLKPLKNDSCFDLYATGFWSCSSFRMDIWKRHGVPFWYPQGAGNIRVAGSQWQPPGRDTIPGTAKAGSQQPGNGAIPFANDDDPSTYWYAGDNRPDGKLWIEFSRPTRVRQVRFLGWATPRHSPKDYRIGLILPSGKRQQIAAVSDEKRMGDWIGFPVDNVEAQGVYLDVAATGESEHGPVVYELQAKGDPVEVQSSFPAEVEIPLGGINAKEFFVLGNVGGGFDTTPDVQTPVGEYVLTYADGKRETIPLIAGKNVAGLRYGHFVPEAEFAFGLPDRNATLEDPAGTRYYHLDEYLAVEPKKQILMFTQAVGKPDQPLKSLTFRCTDPKAWLMMEGLTFRHDGPRMNILTYNGKQLRAYPADGPAAKPPPPDPKAALLLDGMWQYATDPGNLGIRSRYFARDFDAGSWKTMPVPSQWYVQGLDYHGVVWFRRTFQVPSTLTGSTLELDFDRVDYDARVWVNGEYLGRHIGAFSSFQLDATKAIRRGQENLIVVRVDSPIDPGFAGIKTVMKGQAMDDIAMPYAQEGCMGGIYRPVTLHARGDVAIRDLWTTTRLSEDLNHADVTVRLTLDGPPSEVALTCRLDGKPVSRDVHLDGRTAVEIAIPVENPRLWYPWEQGKPELCTLEVEARRGDEMLDRHVSHIGIREIRFDAQKQCILINHHRMFLKGMLNDDVHWQSMMDRTGYRQRIQLQMDANLNVIRLTTHQSSREFYELCDEMGMLVWQETPLQWAYSTTGPIRQQILRLVEETVVQTRPYACVIGYSAWNEGGQAGFSDQVAQLMKTLDPSRPMTRACGGGDFDIHVYPGQWWNLNRRSALWCGLTFGFVSETGAYGTSSEQELKEVLGDDIFPFGSAEYFWETFTSYRRIDGPVYLDAPDRVEWTKDQMRDYTLSHCAASERWLCQSMKYMYENFQSQMFTPTTAGIHCRFDDPLPCGWLGIVSFEGKPRKCYYALKEACQQVLPILNFDYTGASDLRVVNEYWKRSWKGATLRYVLRNHAGTEVKRLERKFDLPEDSLVKVMTREEAGDVWHLPGGGLLAELTVLDAGGAVLSQNHYDLTEEEVRSFVTSVYPPAPTAPVDSVIIRAASLSADADQKRIDAERTYSSRVLALAGKPSVKFTATVPHEGTYVVRVAANSGPAIRSFTLQVDGKPAELERYPGLNMNQPITRKNYSSHNLAWYPGWTVSLASGAHTMELRWPGSTPVDSVVLDAICVQSLR